MSITRVLESKGGEIVFQLQTHDEPEIRARKEKIKNLLEEKYTWVSELVAQTQCATLRNLGNRIYCEAMLVAIDAQLSELGIVNR